MAINKISEHIVLYTRTCFGPLSADFQSLQWTINLPSDYFGHENVTPTDSFRGDQYIQSTAGKVH
jgi:hypothetical protein